MPLQISRYSSVLEELQKDSDEDEAVIEKNANDELPFQEQWHFEKFEITYRHAESKKEAKAAVSILEIDIIWDFIIISFRFYGEPEGLDSCYYSEFKRLDKFLLKTQHFH